MRKELDRLIVIIKGIRGLLLLIIFGFIAGELIWLFINANEIISESKSSLAEYGDFIGGVFGTIVSFVGLILVAITYLSQKRDLKETQKQMQRQQFENVLFKMLDTLFQMGNEITFHDGNSSISGSEYFDKFLLRMRSYYKKVDSTFDVNVLKLIEKNYGLKFYETYKYSDYFTYFDEETGETHEDFVETTGFKLANRDGFIKWVRENRQDYAGIVYEHVYYKYNAVSGHYFRYLYNIIKYIVTEIESEEEVSRYINLIQAQLTNQQLVLLLYNAVSPLGLSNKSKLPKILNWIRNYGICENMDKSGLIIEVHQEFCKKST
jgi:hypothetical protein